MSGRALAAEGEPRRSLDGEPWQPSEETPRRSLDGEPWQPSEETPRRSLDGEPWQASATAPTRSRAKTQTVYQERYWAPLRCALRQLEQALGDLCTELGISASISGRIKAFDSICRKIQTRRVTYRSIFDLAGLRVIVGSTAECYRLLECVNCRFRLVPGHLRDYIAEPKSNGYRSLHTTVLNCDGVPVEVQLRTFEMNRQAVHGRGAQRSY